MATVRAACNAMGTRVEILLCGADAIQLRAVAEHALEEVAGLDRRWSRFRDDSEISAVNRRAAHEPVRVSPDLLALLRRARGLWELTNGAFDLSLGKLMERRDFRSGATHPETRKGLAGDLSPVGMQLIEVAPSRHEVRFLGAGVQLDLGAIGKGYALDVAAEVCREHGITAGLIHAGTSSVIAIGKVSGQPWEIGLPTIQAARAGCTAADFHNSPQSDALLRRIKLADCALGVSAPWGQSGCRTEPGGGHILDPRTGRPAQGVALAAVVAPGAAEADALATALVVGGEDLQRKLAAQAQGWRSLLVLGDAAGGALRVVDHGITSDC